MSNLRKIDISTVPPELVDGFGNLMVAEPRLLFHSKQLNTNQPLYWDDAEVSGSGTSTAFQANKAHTLISVGAATAGKRVRQTFQRFNYQPGKAQRIIMTWKGATPEAGLVYEIGYGDDRNGVFFRQNGTTPEWVVRSYVSGSAVDTTSSFSLTIPKTNSQQEQWTFDEDTTHIGIIDLEWLGVGTVRCGMVHKGVIYWTNYFHHDNVETDVYMSSPNLPLRYSIENTGSAGAASLQHICSSVISSGGIEEVGIERWIDNDFASITSIGTTPVPVIACRLQSGRIDEVVRLDRLEIFPTSTAKTGLWRLYANPTLSGTALSYTPVANSPLEVAFGTNATTITGGTIIQGGFFDAKEKVSPESKSLRWLGAKIDRTPEVFAVGVRSKTGTLDLECGFSWLDVA